MNGFAEGYSTYYIMAKIYQYGYAYPFIELILGICYLLRFTSSFIFLVAIFVMTFGRIGVAIKLSKHEKFQYACLEHC